MSGIADFLDELFADTASLLVFAVVFVAVIAAGLRFLSPRKDDRPGLGPGPPRPGPADDALLGPLSGAPTSFPPDGEGQAPAAKPAFDLRRGLVTVQKFLSALIMLGMVTVTVGIYFSTEPDDGSRLAFWVLAIATVLAGMHLHKMARRHAHPEEEAASRAEFRQTAETILSGKIADALLQGKVQWDVASPTVQRIDQETLDRARSMDAAGAPTEEICRAIEPDYDGWTAPFQQMYQNLVRAAIEHGRDA